MRILLIVADYPIALAAKTSLLTGWYIGLEKGRNSRRDNFKNILQKIARTIAYNPAIFSTQKQSRGIVRIVKFVG
jgi:hypothetical protein